MSKLSAHIFEFQKSLTFVFCFVMFLLLCTHAFSNGSIEIKWNVYLVISSVLTALGVPGGTAANTFDDAYLDEVSRSERKHNFNN